MARLIADLPSVVAIGAVVVALVALLLALRLLVARLARDEEADVLPVARREPPLSRRAATGVAPGAFRDLRPGYDPDYDEPIEAPQPVPSAYWPEDSGARRRRGRTTLAFLAGLGAGLLIAAILPPRQLIGDALLLVTRDEVGPPRPEAAGAVTDATPARSEAAQAASASNAPSAPDTAGDATDDDSDLDGLLDRFIREMRGRVPVAVDRTTTLVGVVLDDEALTLQYWVAQTLSSEEIGAVADRLRRQIEGNTCRLAKTEPLRYFNDRGIPLGFQYTDQAGQTVAKITLPAHFCKPT